MISASLTGSRTCAGSSSKIFIVILASKRSTSATGLAEIRSIAVERSHD
jgi:hypothetical protein